MFGRALLLTAACFCLTGTSCQTALRARQALRPAPQVHCLRSALLASPDVVNIVEEFQMQGADGFAVNLRDTTTAVGTRYATLRRDSPDHSDRVTMLISWPGTRRPPAAEEESAKKLVNRVLAHLQRSCAPGDATVAFCDRYDNKWHRCVQ